MSDQQPVLELVDLSVAYQTSSGLVNAVNDVNLTIYQEEIVGLVGESGSGKSTMAYAIMHLLKGDAFITKGVIKVMGQNVYAMSVKELRQFRWDQMAMVFQSAMSALNPVMTVETQILDTILAHRKQWSRDKALARANELLDLVRIDRKALKSYPHELSGGMRQRVVIAIAIALNPGFVIMDEPTTALDVVVQRSILDQIREIQRQEKFAVLFISHDFSLVAEMASKVAIMYAGRLVEMTDSGTLSLGQTHHPYTEGLLRAIPHLTTDKIVIEGIPGSPPNLVNLPTGCAFHPLCPKVVSICKIERPLPFMSQNGMVECHLFSQDKEVEHVGY